MAEFLAVIWLNEKTSRKDILSVQRLQFEGVTLERYMNDKACASFIASQIHTFFVCKTESGASLLIARLSADDMRGAADAVLSSCIGETAIQITEVLRSGEKKEQACVGYRNSAGKTEFKDITIPASDIVTPALGVPVVSADPEKLNVDGIMASVLATIGSAIIAEAMRPGSSADSLLAKGTEMIKVAAPKIQEAIEIGIPMAKGAGDVIAQSVEALAEHGRVAASQFIAKMFKTGVTAAGVGATASTVANMATITSISLIPNSAAAIGSTALIGTGAAAASAVPGMLTIPYAGWILAGITVAALAVTCTCCAIAKSIPIPRRIENDIKKVGVALQNYAANPYPQMVYQLVYAAGPNWKTQLDSVPKQGTAFVDSSISDGEEAVALIVRTKGAEAWEDAFPGWFLMNTQSYILEMSSGERVPLGIVSSNKEFADFLRKRMPPLSNERYSGIIEKFAKQF